MHATATASGGNTGHPEGVSPNASWSDIGLAKRNARDRLIPNSWKIPTENYAARTNVLDVPLTCGILTDREITITSNYDAVDIVNGIKAGTFSAKEVTVAFCKRAAIAQQLTNCLTEIFFNEAIERAQALDQERKDNPEKDLRPLHGLPISIKDTYHYPGYDASIGLACYAFDPSTSYSPLPELLVSLGAILYCKTNVPQTMMTADSDNNLFGRTINPLNRLLTAGGSTGGEGALIAMRGSILGFGTDLAGSIRIPSLCNGIYGFKPSSCLIPFSGQRIPFPPGWEEIGIIASAGPLATSVRSCSFALETIIKSVPADMCSGTLRFPWNVDMASIRAVDKSRLRIGLVLDDGLSTPTPPMRRALHESVEKLEKAGVQIVPFQLPLVREMNEVIGELFALDGSKHLLGLLESKKEPLVPSVENIGLLIVGPSKTIEEYFHLNQRRQVISKVYSDLWRHNKLDAVIMPPAPYTAVPLDSWSTASYTAIFNLLDYPAFVIPVGTVDSLDIRDSVANAKYGDDDAELYKKYTGPANYFGAAISVQLIGMKQNDQEFTIIASAVDSILRGQ